MKATSAAGNDIGSGLAGFMAGSLRVQVTRAEIIQYHGTVANFLDCLKAVIN